jgi:hypothetical protein
MRIDASAWRLVVLFTVLPAVLAADRSGHAQGTATIGVDDPRPLAKAIRTLEDRHGIVITYEDPPYVHQSQIADVTDSVARSPMPKGRRVLVPRGGPLEFAYTLGPSGSSAQMHHVLDRLVAEYDARGYDGRFRVFRSGEHFHVVPTVRRDRNGNPEAYGAILSTEISISRQGTAREVLTEIAAALTNRTGAAVFLGTIPMGRSMLQVVSISAEKEPARSVLLRTLAATGARLSWALYYGPESSPPRYVLNVHGVPRPEHSPSGTR